MLRPLHEAVRMARAGLYPGTGSGWKVLGTGCWVPLQVHGSAALRGGGWQRAGKFAFPETCWIGD